MDGGGEVMVEGAAVPWKSGERGEKQQTRGHVAWAPAGDHHETITSRRRIGSVHTRART